MLSYNINVDRHEARLCFFCNTSSFLSQQLGEFFRKSSLCHFFSFIVHSSIQGIVLSRLFNFSQYHLNLCPFSIIKMSLRQHLFCTDLFLCTEIYYTNQKCFLWDFIVLCLYHLENILCHCVSKCRNWEKCCTTPFTGTLSKSWIHIGEVDWVWY